MPLEYRTKEGDTADLIAWRHYGRQDNKIVETLLDANKGLADYGAELPAGLLVTLPDIETPTNAEVVRLWD